MRDALKRMTKEYVSPILPKYPTPPDPVEDAPMPVPYVPMPYPPFSYYGGTQNMQPIISSITLGHNTPNPNTNPEAVLEDVRQIITNIQAQQNPTIPQGVDPE